MSLTKQLRELGEGESITVLPSEQKAVYVTASRLKIKVKTERIDDRVKVYRIAAKVPQVEKTLADRVRDLSTADRLELFAQFELCCGMNRGNCKCEPEPVQIAPTVADDKQAKLAGLRELIAPLETGEQIAPVDVADQWQGWTEERQALDEIAGETVTYRQHIKTGKRKEIRRESAW